VIPFMLRRRSPDGGAAVFSGEYQVLMPGGTDVTPKPAVAPVEAEAETDADEETMSDELVPAS